MKKLLLLSAIFTLTISAARAQLTSTITTRLHDPGFSMGRDFWLAAPSNNWGGSDEILQINITSPKTTTAYVEQGGSKTSVKVTAYTVATFSVPQSWEMESSSIVETKAIHVYSDDADLSVCFWSHQSYFGEGTSIIPTIGWGTDYVVAAFASLFEANGNSSYDYPSECVMVSNQDNTSVAITPSCNCRMCTTGNEDGNADATVVADPAGRTFTVILNRGQSLQLMPVLATDPDNFDLTGTVIHASNPIGVIGGAMQTNIPTEYTPDGFVCEMIPPVSRWGETYYTTNFYEPSSVTSADALYLFIASQQNQTISRYDCTTGPHVECTIPNQYGIYWNELPGAQKFTSSAPFLVVSYMNNASYYSGSGAVGCPAECAMNAREQYTPSETFQVLESPSNGLGFTNYANIIVNINDALNITFDGTKLSGHPAQCIDGNWESITIPDVARGTHTIVGSDSGVGVNVYAYGNGESYAWSSPCFEGMFQSPDTIAPNVDTFGNCYSAFVHVADSGRLPNRVDTESGIAEIRLDSENNMTYARDADFTDGIETDTSGYSTFVVDTTKPGMLAITVFDFAGNSTTITTTYTPNFAEIEPPVRNLGIYFPASAPSIAYDTLINEGAAPFIIGELHLKYGNVGFSIDSAVDLSPLMPGARRLIKIQFIDPNSQRQIDSIIFGNACELQSVAVIGSGGAADFTVTSQTWPNEPLTDPPTCYLDSVQIENLSPNPITIDSVSWPDQVHFHAVATSAFTVPPSPASVSFLFDYCPDSNSVITPNRTQVSWFSPQVLASGKEDPRFDSLIGWAFAPLAVVKENNPPLSASVIPMDEGRSLEIILPANVIAPVNFELVNVLGQSVLREAFPPGTQTVDASGLPRGVYFYRLTIGHESQNGKVILGQ